MITFAAVKTHIFSGLNLLKTRPWLNQEMIYNRMVVPVNQNYEIDKPNIKRSILPSTRADFLQ